MTIHGRLAIVEPAILVLDTFIRRIQKDLIK